MNHISVYLYLKRSFLDASLGFAAGVMTAASFWSLLLPALDIAEKLNGQGSKFFSLVPVVIGFMIGALFVHMTDILLPQDVRKTLIYLLIIVYPLFFVYRLPI